MAEESLLALPKRRIETLNVGLLTNCIGTVKNYKMFLVKMPLPKLSDRASIPLGQCMRCSTYADKLCIL